MGCYEVIIEDWFAAAHQLRLPGGALEPLHGHNWRVRLCYRGTTLDEMGVLVDFTELKPALRGLLQNMHDRHLNELMQFQERSPSAENVATVIAEHFGRLRFGSPAWVEVEEAPGCTARYYPTESSTCPPP